MLLAICNGRRCSECPCRLNGINCVAVDNGKADGETLERVISTYNDLFNLNNLDNILEDDILSILLQ